MSPGPNPPRQSAQGRVRQLASEPGCFCSPRHLWTQYRRPEPARRPKLGPAEGRAASARPGARGCRPRNGGGGRTEPKDMIRSAGSKAQRTEPGATRRADGGAERLVSHGLAYGNTVTERGAGPAQPAGCSRSRRRLRRYMTAHLRARDPPPIVDLREGWRLSDSETVQASRCEPDARARSFGARARGSTSMSRARSLDCSRRLRLRSCSSRLWASSMRWISRSSLPPPPPPPPPTPPPPINDCGSANEHAVFF